MALPRVSVVLTFWNEVQFLPEAIKSVMAQTYRDWELLLVDDGSTDGSSQIARNYAKMDSERVRYLEHENHQNLGISASRNLGNRAARGEFIASLDGDDVWLPQKLEKHLRILEAHPDVGMLYGATEYWHSWTGRAEDVQRDRVWCNFGVEPNTLVPPPKPLLLFLRDDSVPCTSSVIVRRSACERVGGFEEYFRYGYTDHAFYAKMALLAPVFIADGCWERYRQHADSCCQFVQRMGLAEALMLKYLTWLENILYFHGLEDQEVWAAVDRALAHFRLADRNKLPKRRGGRRNRATVWLRRILGGLSSCGNGPTTPPTLDAIQRSAPELDAAGLSSCFAQPRRLDPVSRDWGYDRGVPIDRYYIENFLDRHAGDIRGHVLEIGVDSYTWRFGGDRVTKSDVLNLEEENPRATIIADLTQAEHVPSERFDCAIVTQTLHLIYDIRAALGTLQRILKPGGVVLATFPGITRISHDQWAGSWFWGFTSASAERLFGECFAKVHVESFGNVLAASAFLYGFAVEDLRLEELDYQDADYELVISVRAVKAEAEK